MGETEGFPAITLWQPWASLVACGAKRWETRGWRTSYRGPLRIHAAKVERPEEAALVALPAIHDALWPALGFDRRPMPTSVRERLPRGAIVATVNVVDCVRMVGPGPISTETLTETLRPDGFVVVGPEQLAFYRPGIADGELSVDISDQREFGDWEPGRWAWRLEDIAPTTDRCPACWGDRVRDLDGGGACYDPDCSCEDCPTCEGHGSCEPVPAMGGQRIWRWRP